MSKYFGTDGVRGVANEGLTAEMAYRIGRFIGSYPNGKKNKILISKDTRVSGNLLSFALVSGILSSGSNVYDEGVSTTPSISFLVEENNFDYGVMISASHNPYYDNGIKIFNRNGEKLESEIEDLIEAYMDSPTDYLPLKQNKEIGIYEYGGDLFDAYINFLIGKTGGADLSSFRILVDCANGSTSSVAPELFRKLNIKADFIYRDPDGYNINDLCGATHVKALQKAIRESKTKYDLGFSFDGDGDRLICVTGDGEAVDGDAVIYLNAVAMKKLGCLKDNVVVVTPMSNLGLHKALKDEQIELFQAKVGDRYVQLALKEHNWSLGGEQSGHVIFLDDLNTGDGLLSALKVLLVMKDSKKSLGELVEKLVIYPQVLKNIVVKNKDAVSSHVGLNNLISKLALELGEEGRIVVRPSGTEPLIRVMVEAKTIDICHNVADQVIAFINEISY